MPTLIGSYRTVDVHAGDEPVCLILVGIPGLPRDCSCRAIAVHVSDGGASFAFDSVPAFAVALDLPIDPPGYRPALRP